MASTANLAKALAQGTLFVQKNPMISGEVRIQFNNPGISPINLNHTSTENIMLHDGVTVDACRKSNLSSLVSQGLIRVVV